MNTRLAVATHILTFLQAQQGHPATSELIAASVNTNPALVRRLLSHLAKAGLTKSQMGSGGGALLARPGGSITLLDVYRAIGEGSEVFPIHREPNPLCPVGRSIQPLLRQRLSEVEKAMESQLARTTIAAMAKDVAAAGQAT